MIIKMEGPGYIYPVPTILRRYKIRYISLAVSKTHVNKQILLIIIPVLEIRRCANFKQYLILATGVRSYLRISSLKNTEAAPYGSHLGRRH